MERIRWRSCSQGKTEMGNGDVDGDKYNDNKIMMMMIVTIWSHRLQVKPVNFFLSFHEIFVIFWDFIDDYVLWNLELCEFWSIGTPGKVTPTLESRILDKVTFRHRHKCEQK